ncbi:hypothetical protein JOM56_002499 [Amanita muscaria]
MPFNLTIGTERAAALQQSIQDELTRRGYSQDADPVMAEYITIMVINNKTAAQITSELEDLIGPDFDSSFTEWLFAEAAKGAPGAEEPIAVASSSAEPIVEPSSPKDAPSYTGADSSRRTSNGPRIYQQAVSQAIPATSAGQKRRAEGRSPSPNTPNKSRRTDLPTGPRAMQHRESPQANSRSLIDRVGGPAGMRTTGSAGPNFKHDEIQARIDNIVNNAPENNMMIPGGFPGMNGMDMNPMGNPLMLHDMMMNQMALMAQMASSMGMLNPATGQFVNQGFPMQGVMPQDMGMFPGGVNNGMPGQMGMANGRGRGGGRGGRGAGRGRGGSVSAPAPKTAETPAVEAAPFQQPAIVAPIPAPVTPASLPSVVPTPTPQQRIPYALPERPQSPTLCKFGLKCTNPNCRYSHPSPVATAESGVVLSNEACEKGKDCKDQDCIKAHVSPATLNPPAEQPAPAPVHHTPHAHSSPIPCRFGAACTRPNCTFTHPRNVHHNTPCKFGAGCTRASCPYQHPEGRTLPSTFHRGLSTSAPLVNVQTPETGSMGGTSHHKSMTFNNPGPGAGVKEKLERQMREIQEKKSEAERAVREAEAAAAATAAAKKKEETKPVPITV